MHSALAEGITGSVGHIGLSSNLRAAMRGLTYPGADSFSEEEASRTWLALRGAFEHICHHNAGTLSFEELYRYAYTLVLYKRGRMLYEGTYHCMEEQLRGVAEKIAAQHDQQLFLRNLIEAWNESTVNIGLIRDILMYLDRNFVPLHRLDNVYTMGVQLFYGVVQQDKRIRHRMKHILLSKIQDERNGQEIDHGLMRTCIRMLTDLGNHVHKSVYHEEFEEAFLDASEEFYKQEAATFLSSNAATEYVIKAHQRILEENRRVDDYLNSDTTAPLNSLLSRIWVQQHYEAVVHNPESGCAFLFQYDRVEDLKRIYDLLSRVSEARALLCVVMKECLMNCGNGILRDPERTRDPVVFVNSFLALKGKFSRIVQESLGDSKDFYATLKVAFEDFLNRDARAARFLSLYIDDLFKKSIRGMSDTEVDGHLNNVLLLFRFLRDKDVFESRYKEDLSKRLLQKRTLSRDAEKSMIDKLTAECGQFYTSKLEKMFKDYVLSDQLMEEYSQYKLQTIHDAANAGFASRIPAYRPSHYQSTRMIAGGDSAASRIENDTGRIAESERDLQNRSSSKTSGYVKVDFSVRVLTHGTWPNITDPIKDVRILPECLQWEVESFTSFYLSRRNSRVLSWVLDEGRGTVAGMFRTKHELDCTTLQMILLCMFNTYSSISVRSLMSVLLEKSSCLRQQEVKRHLLSMCTPRCKLLDRKSQDGLITRELRDDDLLEVNEQFTSRSIRVKVPILTPGSITGNQPGSSDASCFFGQREGADVPMSVEQDRNCLVEACIVRVMKSRQELSHNDLIVEVTRLLSQRFRPEPVLIKNRIEILIEREYLERDASDRRRYRYVA